MEIVQLKEDSIPKAEYEMKANVLLENLKELSMTLSY